MATILRLAKDLGGSQWIQYNKLFREWAAAKEIKVWGELNLAIFGQCLAAQQRIKLQQQIKGSPNSERPGVPLIGGHRDVAYGTSRESAQGLNADSSTTATSVEEIIEPITVIQRGQEDDPSQGRKVTSIVY